MLWVCASESTTCFPFFFLTGLGIRFFQVCFRLFSGFNYFWDLQNVAPPVGYNFRVLGFRVLGFRVLGF